MEFDGAPGKISLRLVSWDIHSLIHMDYGYYAYVPLPHQCERSFLKFSNVPINQTLLTLDSTPGQHSYHKIDIRQYG